MKNKSEAFYDSKVVFHPKKTSCLFVDASCRSYILGPSEKELMYAMMFLRCGGDGMVTSFSGNLIENTYSSFVFSRYLGVAQPCTVLLFGSTQISMGCFSNHRFQIFGNSTSNIAHLVWPAIRSTKHVDLS